MLHRSIIILGVSAIALLTKETPVVNAWTQETLSPTTTGPGARRGHSLVVLNETKVILFGGRGNDAHRQHVPKRFDIVEIDGVLEFSTLDSMPLNNIYSPDSELCQPVMTCVSLKNSSSENNEVCSYSWHHLLHDGISPSDQATVEAMCGFAPAGVYYNDVWLYDTDCLRYAEKSCVNDGWRIVHEGSAFGGCNNVEGKLVCEAPSERYDHGATMLDDSTMAVYGGFSNECEDYCDDFWLFNFASLQWTKVETILNPGNRWQFSMIAASNSIYLFGGHRLWHGMAPDNSEANRWNSSTMLPKGGYLDDLWVYGHSPILNGSSMKEWTKVEGKITCVDSPGLTWESRNDKHCSVHWPSARSGHALVYDPKRGGLWLHGGYSTYYPYPTSKSPGSGPGVQTLGLEHVALLPTYAFYLDDLWFYDIKSGYWERKKIFGRRPYRRTNHIVSVSDNMLVLHGGFGDGHHFNDTWHYIIDENRWLKKDNFVHASYPDSRCINDLETIQNDSTCVELKFPDDLKRSNETTLAIKYQDILPFKDQKGYTPDPDYPLYFGIVDDADVFVNELHQKYSEQGVYDEKGQRIWLESTVPEGTPIAPKAASAPRQYARRRMMKYNQTLDLEVWEWCVSVKGEPTRGRTNDGRHGRSNVSVYIPQPRRQSPGWDGCRDLQWIYPASRANHASVYVDKFDMLIVHGGMSYYQRPSNVTPPIMALVLDDMWVLHAHTCAANCSGNGECTHGYCQCNPGYYGIDCSNITCPGSVCGYDTDKSQHCTHCCFDNSVDGRKIPCQLIDTELVQFSGTSEGICDGFGSCQCAPPYIGEDCSIIDCKYNCSFNGYCMIEFPQSRCQCKDGYTGEYCQHMACTNNCSYPNGLCDQDTGHCNCNSFYSPKNKAWIPWQGLDCSNLHDQNYMDIFSSASDFGIVYATMIVLIVGFFTAIPIII